MSDYMTLMGAEDVKNAGHNMHHASQEMSRAAGNIDFAMTRFHNSAQEFLDRFERLVERIEAASTAQKA